MDVVNDIERREKFVSEQNEEIQEFDDDLLIFANRATLSFLKWYSLYFNSRKQEYEELLANETCIVNSNDTINKTKLKLMKLLFKHENRFEEIRVAVEERDIFYELYFPENSRIKEQDKLTQNLEDFSKTLIEKIRTSSYPMIWYYSSTDGMKQWFSNRISISHFPPEVKRMFQYYTGDEETYQTAMKLSRDRVNQLLTVEVVNKNTAKIRMIALYNLCNYLVEYLFEIECRLFRSMKQEFNYSGIAYRGEMMTAKELEELQKKVQPVSFENLQYHLFSQRLVSTSRDEGIARRFLLSNSSRTKKQLLHQIHLVRPTDEEINEFKRMFPNQLLQNTSHNIDQLSFFPKEKEILCSGFMFVQFLDIKEDTDGIWKVQSISPTIELENTNEIDTDNISNKEDWFELVEAVDTQLAERILQLAAKHPTYLPEFYLHSLNRKCVAQEILKLFPQHSHSQSMRDVVTEMNRYLHFIKSIFENSQ